MVLDKDFRAVCYCELIDFCVYGFAVFIQNCFPILVCHFFSRVLFGLSYVWVYYHIWGLNHRYPSISFRLSESASARNIRCFRFILCFTGWLLYPFRRTIGAQPCRIHPSRGIRHVLVRIDPTRQLHWIRRQVTTNIRIVVAMAVVVQPAFLIEILTLETQRIVDFSDVEAGDFPVGTVMRRPDDFAIRGGEFLRGAQVVELVVVGLGFLGAEAFQQRQRAKAVWFIEIAAMPIRVVFGDEFVALPEELGGDAVDGFADTPPCTRT